MATVVLAEHDDGEAGFRHAAYAIGTSRFEVHSPGFAEAVAAAHQSHLRPRCLCRADGIEMYVARLGDGYIVKRMPDTGCRHAPDCPSYEPPAGASGLGQVLGTAIVEDPATGETTLRLEFALSRMPGRSTLPATGSGDGRVRTNGERLGLRGLLHYLWDQADLTRWQPGFEGKRTWAVVRGHLLRAADRLTACGEPLRARLYVPEPFTVDQRDAINARRLAQWLNAVAVPSKPQRLMLMVAEVKEIVPARYGFKVVVKHVPDQAFALDERMYRRLGRLFEGELALWGASDDLHMVIIGTFGVATSGTPTIVELSLMPATRQWLPVEDGFEKVLVERLVAEERAFVKALRYDLDANIPAACATLIDCEGSAPQLHIDRSDDAPGHVQPVGESVWIWRPSMGRMAELPARARDLSRV